VIGGTYWAAAGLLRDADRRWLTEDDVRCLALLSEPIADGVRRARLVTAPGAIDNPGNGPGVIVFDGTATPSRFRPLPSIGSARWSKFRRLPSQPNPRSSKRSPGGPALSTPARTRCRSARGPAYGPGPARGCCCTVAHRFSNLPLIAEIGTASTRQASRPADPCTGSTFLGLLAGS
jgi:hypothetical protein